MVTRDGAPTSQLEESALLFDRDHDEVIASDGERSAAISIAPEGDAPGERRPCWRVDDHLGTVVRLSSYLDAERLARELAHQLLAYRQIASQLAHRYGGDLPPPPNGSSWPRNGWAPF